MGEIMNSPKRVKSGVLDEHFLAQKWHPSRFTQITGNQSYVTVSEEPFNIRDTDGQIESNKYVQMWNKHI